MIKTLIVAFYARRMRRCSALGHEKIVAERAGRRDGLCVIEQRLQCGRCQHPLSEWEVVLTEDSVETLWKSA